MRGVLPLPLGANDRPQSKRWCNDDVGGIELSVESYSVSLHGHTHPETVVNVSRKNLSIRC